MKQKKKVLLGAIVWLLIIANITAFFIIPWFEKYQVFGKYIRRIETDQKVIALTFDDGPNPPVTNEILELLMKHHAKATFFILGKHANENMELIKKIYSNGNEIGNHSWNHEKLLLRSPAFIKREISQTDEIIRKSGYLGKIYFRSPYGSRFLFLPYQLMRENRVHILWNITLGDWENPNAELILQRLNDQLVPGSIILLHDGFPNEYAARNNTVRAVDLVLQKYAKEDYRFVTISELLDMGSPKKGIVF